ncbi:hypothetical protein [Halostella litorea]|uniref:hypothetical protein n=1 Tax=Halostella litorea TaxID=2528831 RepID=UPI0010919AE6|nr:hypothetical protein [Halostella litorea]
MAVNTSRNESDGGITLPDVVPFALSNPTRLSWELGTRSVRGEDATVLGRWDHLNSRWRLSLFEVTSETAIVRARTPVGRERFYGAIRSELRPAVRALETSDSWQQVE